MRIPGGSTFMSPLYLVLVSIAALQRVSFSCRRRSGLGIFRVPLDGAFDRTGDNSRDRVLMTPICYAFYYTHSLLYVQF